MKRSLKAEFWGNLCHSGTAGKFYLVAPRPFEKAAFAAIPTSKMSGFPAAARPSAKVAEGRGRNYY